MLDIRNLTRSPYSKNPYKEMADAILPGWDISLVFVGETRAQNLNKQLRNKDYVPNVLSYESGPKSGEIIICPAVAKRENLLYGMGCHQYVGYLFIHGLLHLKGHPHGPTMDRLEREHLSRFIGVSLATSNGTTHRDRHRHRNAPDKGRGGRRGTRR